MDSVLHRRRLAITLSCMAGHGSQRSVKPAQSPRSVQGKSFRSSERSRATATANSWLATPGSAAVEGVLQEDSLVRLAGVAAVVHGSHLQAPLPPHRDPHLHV